MSLKGRALDLFPKWPTYRQIWMKDLTFTTTNLKKLINGRRIKFKKIQNPQLAVLTFWKSLIYRFGALIAKLSVQAII